ncbi:hypothetical protein [Psittacicella hinzii]|uniref:Uncharacterized protein n=1 Tax=Psittacicella hinzii TaxID=2028575 RepID=A0A3A1YCI8_9GAMM|nr:hypothetical protein [Psittacicella hinzii]RIY34898.1 hypothetical protein CKF58_07420 [Psittacicella hinzii]
MTEKKISFGEFSQQQDSELNTEFTQRFDQLAQEYSGLLENLEQRKSLLDSALALLEEYHALLTDLINSTHGKK